MEYTIPMTTVQTEKQTGPLRTLLTMTVTVVKTTRLKIWMMTTTDLSMPTTHVWWVTLVGFLQTRPITILMVAKTHLKIWMMTTTEYWMPMTHV